MLDLKSVKGSTITGVSTPIESLQTLYMISFIRRRSSHTLESHSVDLLCTAQRFKLFPHRRSPTIYSLIFLLPPSCASFEVVLTTSFSVLILSILNRAITLVLDCTASGLCTFSRNHHTAMNKLSTTTIVLFTEACDEPG